MIQNKGNSSRWAIHTGKRILRNHWTVLPMPNNVVDAVHTLAVSSKQAGGITFTNNDGNIITDDDDDEIEEAMENDEQIPVPYNHHETSSTIIRKKQTKRQIQEWMIKHSRCTWHHTISTRKSRWGIYRSGQTEHRNTHDNIQPISQEENDPDKYMTIGVINITSEINASNRGAEMEHTKNEETDIRTNECYNLWPRLTNRVQFALVQSNQQTITLPKKHTHIMITQLNIKDGLKAFGNKHDEAILKEIKRLNTRQALKPCIRNKMSQEERKRALRYLCS